MTATVGIVDYGIGNVRSVVNAVAHVGAEPILSADVAELEACDRLILPGVGAFPRGMQALEERGLAPFVRRYVADDRPCLGICLGMQMLMLDSTEFGRTAGLGLLDGGVESLKDLRADGAIRRLPNVGWLGLEPAPAVESLGARLLQGLEPEDRFYFVHSYAVGADAPSAAAIADYEGARFAAIVSRGNLAGTQFHPEKSGEAGLRMLNNFIFR